MKYSDKKKYSGIGPARTWIQGNDAKWLLKKIKKTNLQYSRKIEACQKIYRTNVILSRGCDGGWLKIMLPRMLNFEPTQGGYRRLQNVVGKECSSNIKSYCEKLISLFFHFFKICFWDIETYLFG